MNNLNLSTKLTEAQNLVKDYEIQKKVSSGSRKLIDTEKNEILELLFPVLNSLQPDKSVLRLSTYSSFLSSNKLGNVLRGIDGLFKLLDESKGAAGTETETPAAGTETETETETAGTETETETETEPAGTETETAETPPAAAPRTKKLSEDSDIVREIGKPAAEALDRKAERDGTNKIGELSVAQKQAIRDKIAEIRRSAGS
ncbi:MAG: hypothetical protein RLZZ361_462 [Cyanobacteriota bacterium]